MHIESLSHQWVVVVLEQELGEVVQVHAEVITGLNEAKMNVSFVQE